MPPTAHKTILLVDDDPEIIDSMRTVLEGKGYRVLVARDGNAALAVAEREEPDLIILDVMLPDINGKAVCELIRSDPTLADIKIICISGMVEQDKVADLRSAGADDFMQKPFAVDKLVDRACDLLEMERVTAS